MTYPVPHLVRLEYLTREGWVVGHAAINLLDPGRYVERLAAKGKFGRATELDTGEVWEPAELPDLALLYPSDNKVPSVKCHFCEGTGHAPGECLL